MEAVVPSPPGIESDTERGRKSKQKKRSRLVFERVSNEEETAPSQRPTERQPLNEDNAAKRRVSPPASRSVGGGGGGRRSRKQPENGTVLFPFDSRFSHDFDCWQSEWMRRRRGRGTWLSQHTHTGRQGWARSARKVNEEGFFLLKKKKKFGAGFGWKLRTLFFVFEVGESVRGFLKRERRNFMNKESCKLVEAKLQTIYYTHTYTRGGERERARKREFVSSIKV